MSPQSHRGRSGSGRKARGHIDYTPRPKPAEAAPADAASAEDTPAEDATETRPASSASTRAAGSRTAESAAEARNRSEARRAARVSPTKKKRQHGLVYRWLRAYFPLLIGLFVLLAIVWGYTTYLKPPTPQQQWQTIEQKWSPEREKARAELAAAVAATPFDLARYQTAVRTYSSQIKGWTDEVVAVKDWGEDGNATENVANFKLTSESFQSILIQLAESKTVYDVADLESYVQGYDQEFTGAVARMRTTWNLSTPAASPSPMAFPSVVPTESPAASPTAAPTATAAATPTPAPTASPAASAT